MATLDPRLVSLAAPASFAAEQYQGLRLTVERLARTREAKVIAISSPAAGDGKTVTAINLAGALARGSDERVLLIDADLRRPAIAKQLGLVGVTSGFTEALTDLVPLRDVVTRIDSFNLDVVPAGRVRAGISQTLRSPHLEEFLVQARQQYAYVVVDTPPLLPVFDAALLAKFVDGVLLVVSANQTPRKLLGEALNMLDASKVLGIVFNRDERPLFGYYNSYYREYFPEATVAGSRA
jgi:capsular exopolysaccharide synthesis family protein